MGSDQGSGIQIMGWRPTKNWVQAFVGKANHPSRQNYLHNRPLTNPLNKRPLQLPITFQSSVLDRSTLNPVLLLQDQLHQETTRFRTRSNQIQEMAYCYLLHHPRSFLKAFAVSVPLICLLLSWASSATTTTEPSSSVAASQLLQSRGYILFATLINANAGTGSWNGTGTVLAPPDFAFSFAGPKFTRSHRRSSPPRPTASLLLYHTLKQPLTWHNLTERVDGDELPTWHSNQCLFVSKGFNSDFAIAGSKKPIMTVKIRQPDLYVDDHLAVHGIDGVLDPTSASTCSVPDRTAQIKSQVERSLLDHAVQTLKRRRFSVVATALAVKSSNLRDLAAVTVFAPSDASLFSGLNGFRFDFFHHVVPKRYRYADIARLGGWVIQTLSPNKTVSILSENGDVTINGVSIGRSEVYHNRWITVLSVSRSIDDTGNSEEVGAISGAGASSSVPSYFSDSASGSTFSGGSAVSPVPPRSYFKDSKANRQFSEFARIPSPASSHTEEVGGGGESLAPANAGDHRQGEGIESSRVSASTVTDVVTIADFRCSPAVPPASPDGAVSTISLTVDGQELFCPLTVRTAGERGAPVGANVVPSPPSIAYSQLSEKMAPSGPSHEFNKVSETGVRSQASAADVERRELRSGLKLSLGAPEQ
ncbi:hypothetical protein NMG60_11023261 [Bertholletia excelsa]